jgi:addiction module RelB/DinJ family antitoxin
VKDASILLRARVPERRYRNAEEILNRLGMNPGDAVNLLMAQIELRQGLPFEVSLDPGGLLTQRQQGAAWEEAFGESKSKDGIA